MFLVHIFCLPVIFYCLAVAACVFAHPRLQTREIELMREELVRLRAKTFPSFAQLRDSFMLD
jgi:hypothetical protein